MPTEITVALIALIAALTGTWGGIWSTTWALKKNAKLQDDLIEKQIKNSFQMLVMDKKLETELAEKQIKNNFQLAAMDKRLEAHQKAYHIWSKMASYVFAPHDDRLKLRSEAYEFLTTHCLYLEPKSAEAFRQCINFYYDYQTQLDFAKALDRQSSEAQELLGHLKIWWDHIHDTGRMIMEGAKYPFIDMEPTIEDPMGERKEEKEIKKKDN